MTQNKFIIASIAIVILAIALGLAGLTAYNNRPMPTCSVPAPIASTSPTTASFETADGATPAPVPMREHSC